MTGTVSYTLRYSGMDSYLLTVTDLNNDGSVVAPSPINVSDGFSRVFTSVASDAHFGDIHINGNGHGQPYNISLINDGETFELY